MSSLSIKDEVKLIQAKRWIDCEVESVVESGEWRAVKIAVCQGIVR